MVSKMQPLQQTLKLAALSSRLLKHFVSRHTFGLLPSLAEQLLAQPAARTHAHKLYRTPKTSTPVLAS